MVVYGTNPIALPNDVDQRFGADITLAQCLDEAACVGIDGIAKGHAFSATVQGLTAVLQSKGLRFVSDCQSTNLLVDSIEAEKAAMRPLPEVLKGMGSDCSIVCKASNASHVKDGVTVNDRPRLSEDLWAGFGAGIGAQATQDVTPV